MAIIIDRTCDQEIIDSISRKFPSENIIKTSKLKNISDATATHPDMQIHFVNDNMAYCAPECFEYYSRAFSGVTIICGETTPRDTYPMDIAYNAARLGNYVIANTRYTDHKILEYYKEHGFEIINTRQGYAKCSLGIMSDNAVITGDSGLYRLLSKLSDIKCHKTSQENVILPGYKNGFIGGASGLVRNTAVFFGEPAADIKKFLSEMNIEYFCAHDGRLRDYGTLICGGD